MSLTNKKVVERWCDFISGSGVPREGSNSNGSIFYEGDTIYSYGYHFPIAKFEGGRMAIVNKDKYSRTTGRHQSMVRRTLADYCIDHIALVDTETIKGYVKGSR